MEIVIYTDGSCQNNPGPGGWAAIIILDNIKKKILELLCGLRIGKEIIGKPLVKKMLKMLTYGRNLKNLQVLRALSGIG